MFFKSRRNKSKHKTPFLESMPVFVVVMIVVLALDGVALWEIQNLGGEMIGYESKTAVFLMMAAILLALDVIPILVGHFIKANRTMMKVCTIMLITACAVGVTLYMGQKFIYSDAYMDWVGSSENRTSGVETSDESEYGDNDYALQHSESTDLGQDISEEEEEAQPLNVILFKLFTNLITTFMPITTSVISFSISVLRTHGAIYEKKYDLEADISELKNELVAMENFTKDADSGFQLELDKEYEEMMEKVDIENQRLKSDFRNTLILVCKNEEENRLAASFAFSPSPNLSDMNIGKVPMPQPMPRIPMPIPDSAVQRDAGSNLSDVSEFTANYSVGVKTIPLPAMQQNFRYANSDPLLNDDPYFESDD